MIQFRSRVQIGFGFVFGIVELLRTSDFALLSVSGSDDELSLEASVYVFSFSFSEESSVEMSQSGSLADLEVNVVGDKPPPPYLFLDFQFPAQE